MASPFIKNDCEDVDQHVGPIVLHKTNNITQIKGWRKKFSLDGSNKMDIVDDKDSTILNSVPIVEMKSESDCDKPVVSKEFKVNRNSALLDMLVKKIGDPTDITFVSSLATSKDEKYTTEQSSCTRSSNSPACSENYAESVCSIEEKPLLSLPNQIEGVAFERSAFLSESLDEFLSNEPAILKLNDRSLSLPVAEVQDSCQNKTECSSLLNESGPSVISDLLDRLDDKPKTVAKKRRILDDTCCPKKKLKVDAKFRRSERQVSYLKEDNNFRTKNKNRKRLLRSDEGTVSVVNYNETLDISDDIGNSDCTRLTPTNVESKASEKKKSPKSTLKKPLGFRQLLDLRHHRFQSYKSKNKVHKQGNSSAMRKEIRLKLSKINKRIQMEKSLQNAVYIRPLKKRIHFEYMPLLKDDDIVTADSAHEDKIGMVLFLGVGRSLYKEQWQNLEMLRNDDCVIDENFVQFATSTVVDRRVAKSKINRILVPVLSTELLTFMYRYDRIRTLYKNFLINKFKINVPLSSEPNVIETNVDNNHVVSSNSNACELLIGSGVSNVRKSNTQSLSENFKKRRTIRLKKVNKMSSATSAVQRVPIETNNDVVDKETNSTEKPETLEVKFKKQVLKNGRIFHEDKRITKLNYELRRLNHAFLEIDSEHNAGKNLKIPSKSNVSNIKLPDDAIPNKLAKVESEFHQTIMKSDDGLVVVSSFNERSRRTRKLPKKLEDAILSDNTECMNVTDRAQRDSPKKIRQEEDLSSKRMRQESPDRCNNSLVPDSKQLQYIDKGAHSSLRKTINVSDKVTDSQAQNFKEKGKVIVQTTRSILKKNLFKHVNKEVTNAKPSLDVLENFKIIDLEKCIVNKPMVNTTILDQPVKDNVQIKKVRIKALKGSLKADITDKRSTLNSDIENDIRIGKCKSKDIADGFLESAVDEHRILDCPNSLNVKKKKSRSMNVKDLFSDVSINKSSMKEHSDELNFDDDIEIGKCKSTKINRCLLVNSGSKQSIWECLNSLKVGDKDVNDSLCKQNTLEHLNDANGEDNVQNRNCKSSDVKDSFTDNLCDGHCISMRANRTSVEENTTRKKCRCENVRNLFSDDSMNKHCVLDKPDRLNVEDSFETHLICKEIFMEHPNTLSLEDGLKKSEHEDMSVDVSVTKVLKDKSDVSGHSSRTMEENVKKRKSKNYLLNIADGKLGVTECPDDLNNKDGVQKPEHEEVEDSFHVSGESVPNSKSQIKDLNCRSVNVPLDKPDAPKCTKSLDMEDIFHKMKSVASDVCCVNTSDIESDVKIPKDDHVKQKRPFIEIEMLKVDNPNEIWCVAHKMHYCPCLKGNSVSQDSYALWEDSSDINQYELENDHGKTIINCNLQTNENMVVPRIENIMSLKPEDFFSDHITDSVDDDNSANHDSDSLPQTVQTISPMNVLNTVSAGLIDQDTTLSPVKFNPTGEFRFYCVSFSYPFSYVKLCGGISLNKLAAIDSNVNVIIAYAAMVNMVRELYSKRECVYQRLVKPNYDSKKFNNLPFGAYAVCRNMVLFGPYQMNEPHQLQAYKVVENTDCTLVNMLKQEAKQIPFVKPEYIQQYDGIDFAVGHWWYGVSSKAARDRAIMNAIYTKRLGTAMKLNLSLLVPLKVSPVKEAISEIRNGHRNVNISNSKNKLNRSNSTGVEDDSNTNNSVGVTENQCLINKKENTRTNCLKGSQLEAAGFSSPELIEPFRQIECKKQVREIVPIVTKNMYPLKDDLLQQIVKEKCNPGVNFADNGPMMLCIEPNGQVNPISLSRMDQVGNYTYFCMKDDSQHVIKISNIGKKDVLRGAYKMRSISAELIPRSSYMSDANVSKCDESENENTLSNVSNDSVSVDVDSKVNTNNRKTSTSLQSIGCQDRSESQDDLSVYPKVVSLSDVQSYPVLSIPEDVSDNTIAMLSPTKSSPGCCANLEIENLMEENLSDVDSKVKKTHVALSSEKVVGLMNTENATLNKSILMKRNKDKNDVRLNVENSGSSQIGSASSPDMTPSLAGASESPPIVWDSVKCQISGNESSRTLPSVLTTVENVVDGETASNFNTLLNANRTVGPSLGFATEENSVMTSLNDYTSFLSVDEPPVMMVEGTLPTDNMEDDIQILECTKQPNTVLKQTMMKLINEAKSSTAFDESALNREIKSVSNTDSLPNFLESYGIHFTNDDF